MKRLYENGILPTIGGICTLIIVMGIGRFSFTALLPGMMNDHGFGEETAGIMAAWNYTGYLAGVLAMRKETPGLRRYALLTFFLLLSLISTAGMGMVHTVPLWHGMRFLSGLASGVCFVLCSSIVLDTLVAINRPVLAGILYSGVGIGIAVGGMAARFFEARGDQDIAWLGMSLLCIPLTLIALFALRPGVNATPVMQVQGTVSGTGRKDGYGLLCLSYFLEGFGYIIAATFLVALVQTATGSSTLAEMSWIIVGCVAAVSAPIWRYAARRGYLPMLLLAFVLQGVGVLLPVISNSPVAILTGSLLFGGTFMGITVLSLQYGVAISGKSSAHTVALMTALYGIGQIIGPFVAGLSASGQGFAFAFVISAISLFSAAGLLLISIIRKP